MGDEEQYQRMLDVALEEARMGRAEGGIPIGAALFRKTGELMSRGATGGSSKATPAFMARRMHFAWPDGRGAIVTW